MERVSSNSTLFFKFFVPIFWIVFFGAFTVATFAYNFEYFGNIPKWPFRIGVLVFFLSGVLMFYFTLMRLKRVEMDELFIYVTDYFKHYRYPYHNVEKFQESNFLFLQIVTLHLKEPGNFGKKVTFISSKNRYESFFETHPNLRELRSI